MRKLTKIAALVCASLATPTLAQSLEGTVKTLDGKPIANAKVEVEGTGLEVYSDAEGKFAVDKLKQGMNELHIVAPGYSHLHQDLVVNGNIDVTQSFELSRSPIDVIDVIASPIHLSAMESALPVHVLGEEALRRQQSASLGDSLDRLPGIHTNFHAKVASTPIIRGLSGPRVQIAQNGLDVSDVSRVGPDHAVATEASTAQQIEVLRGPATMFYGSGAIGGVVNVVDNRVPTDNETEGEWLLQHSTVDDQNLATFNAKTGVENFAVYVDGYYRDSNDYHVPVAPELETEEEHDEHDEHDAHGNYKVANSAEQSSGFTLGASYLLSNGYIGASVEQFNREYGIPGHSHGEDSHDEDEHDEHQHGDEGHEEDVFADLEQTRVQLLSEFTFKDSLISGLNVRAGFTDYEHAEIEQGTVGTEFKNQTTELRVELLHKQLAHFNGGISLHYKNSQVEAQGSEAFTPPSETEMFALSMLEERHLGNVLLQMGGRIEQVTISADNVLLPHIDAHGHEEDEHDEDEHEHEHESAAEITRVFAVDHEFTPISISAGLLWDFTPGYNLGLAVSRSQRAPSATELLSFGPHIGTRTYEVGALFALEEHEGEMEIGLSDHEIDLETSNNIDLSFRKTEGNIGFIFNLYYNQVDNYYYQVNTGLFGEDGHDHGAHEDEHDDHGHEAEGTDEHDHSGELPIFIFQAQDAVLNGFEAQLAWQVNDTFNATFFSDFVRARLKNGGDLPRTPPLRFGTELSYENESLSAHLAVTRFQGQERITQYETQTDGYTMVDLHVSYDLPIMNESMSVYFKGENLTDTEARVHTSFLKNIAPRPGRNLTLGVKGYF